MWGEKERGERKEEKATPTSRKKKGGGKLNTDWAGEKEPGREPGKKKAPPRFLGAGVGKGGKKKGKGGGGPKMAFFPAEGRPAALGGGEKIWAPCTEGLRRGPGKGEKEKKKKIGPPAAPVRNRRGVRVSSVDKKRKGARPGQAEGEKPCKKKAGQDVYLPTSVHKLGVKRRRGPAYLRKKKG